MANSLNVIKFLQEDIFPSENDTIKELFQNIDLMTYTMDFFRNIYTSSESRGRINEKLLNILKLKDISLIGDIDILLNISPVFENIICGILYICMKSCKASDNVILEKNNDKIIIQLSNRTFPQETQKAFQEPDVEENVFNVFVLFVKYLAKSHDILIHAEFDSNNIKITLWNKK